MLMLSVEQFSHNGLAYKHATVLVLSTENQFNSSHIKLHVCGQVSDSW
jgi:hypothetical protein